MASLARSKREIRTERLATTSNSPGRDESRTEGPSCDGWRDREPLKDWVPSKVGSLLSAHLTCSDDAQRPDAIIVTAFEPKKKNKSPWPHKRGTCIFIQGPRMFIATLLTTTPNGTSPTYFNHRSIHFSIFRPWNVTRQWEWTNNNYTDEYHKHRMKLKEANIIKAGTMTLSLNIKRGAAPLEGMKRNLQWWQWSLSASGC